MLLAFKSVLRPKNYFSMMAVAALHNVAGLCQMRSTNDKKFNRDQVSELVRRAEGKSSFLFFPECVDYVGINADETIALAEPINGQTVQFYKDLCVSKNMWMSFGGIHEVATDEAGKIYNTHIIINSQGEIVQIYRKLHLFDVDTPEFKFRESKIVARGKALSDPVETPIGKIGMLICYDIRFPEASVLLKKRGAQILLYPSAFAVSTGKAHWEILNRSRAIENQCFVISAAQKGKHNDKRSSFGQALAISPMGDILTECREELDIQFVKIDLEKIIKVESNMPCFRHRRNDVYEVVSHDSVKSEESLESGKQFMFEKYPIDPQTIFLETKLSVAFTNIKCVVKGEEINNADSHKQANDLIFMAFAGHVLVATKRSNVSRVEEMTEDETKDLFYVACRIAKVLDDYYDAKSTTITVQDGIFAGQTVKHVHCHIMPRKKGDFENNDEIYVELNKHDTSDLNNRRPLQEMIEEAQIYKKLMLF